MMSKFFTPVPILLTMSIVLTISCSEKSDETSQLASSGDVESLYKISDNQWKVICNYGEDGLQEELVGEYAIETGSLCSRNNPQRSVVSFEGIESTQYFLINKFRSSLTRNGTVRFSNDDKEIKPILKFLPAKRSSAFNLAGLRNAEISLPATNDLQGNPASVIKSVSAKLKKTDAEDLPGVFDSGRFTRSIRSEPDRSAGLQEVELMFHDGTSAILNYGSGLDPLDAVRLHQGIKISLKKAEMFVQNQWWKPATSPHDPIIDTIIDLNLIIALDHPNGESEILKIWTDRTSGFQMPLRKLNDMFAPR